MTSTFPRTHTFVLTLSMALISLTGWAKDAAPAPAVPNPVQALEQVVTQGKGFAVGAPASATTVYVMFDAQCPHCGHLWRTYSP